MTQAAAGQVIADALQQGGDLVGVRFASTEDDEAPDPWTLPPSRNRPEKPVKGPLPSSIEIVRANLPQPQQSHMDQQLRSTFQTAFVRMWRRVCELRQTRTLFAHKKRKRPPVEGVRISVTY
jgi:hypothetical protein